MFYDFNCNVEFNIELYYRDGSDKCTFAWKGNQKKPSDLHEKECKYNEYFGLNLWFFLFFEM